MKIHEYQAKEILKKHGVAVQDGVLVETASEIESALDKAKALFNSEKVVVKAQIHAGGRGKGGGVKFCSDRPTAIENAQNILGMNLITHQTGEAGQLVRKILITEAVDIKTEFYAAITLDRAVGKDVVMVSKEGGVEIEEVVAENPDAIIKVYIEPGMGLLPFQARELTAALGLEGSLAKQALKFFPKLYDAYQKNDASIAEINPLVITGDEKLIALDAKFNFDDNALYRHPEIAEMRDENEEEPTEVEASKFNLNFIKLDGNVGCMVNGAGLAMGTMDIIKLYGGEPANFLDVGGGANVETVKNAFRILLSDENVKAVLINIFGGIVRCDRVANGIIEAVKTLDLSVPVVVRLQGTNAEEARKILAESDLKLIPADTLAEAAEKVVAAAKGQ